MSDSTRAKKKGDTLATMLLPELQSVAARLEIDGAPKLRKGDLVAAIEAKQAENRAAAAKPPKAEKPARKEAAREENSDSESSNGNADNSGNSDRGQKMIDAHS